MSRSWHARAWLIACFKMTSEIYAVSGAKYVAECDLRHLSVSESPLPCLLPDCFVISYSVLNHLPPQSKCALVAIVNVTGLPVARCVVTPHCKSLQAPVSSAHRQLSAVVTHTNCLSNAWRHQFMRPCCEWIWDGNCFLMSFICFKLDGHNYRSLNPHTKQ